MPTLIMIMVTVDDIIKNKENEFTSQPNSAMPLTESFLSV